MASLQGAEAPVKDAATEAEEAVKESRLVAAPPPENTLWSLDVDDEDGLEDLEALPPEEGRVENFEDEEDGDEEEQDLEYSSPFVQRDEATAAPFKWGAGEDPAFDDFNEEEEAEYGEDE